MLYGIINLFAVKWYGESEFWLAMGKVLLIVGLIIFTFITMVGGNPMHDKFGFRYWKNPGAFAELYYDGNLGRFLGAPGGLVAQRMLSRCEEQLRAFCIGVTHATMLRFSMMFPR